MGEVSIDSTLTRADIMDILGFNTNEANAFMREFGHRSGFHKAYKIGAHELTALRLDGVVTEWVKNYCAPNRQTVSERKGKE